MNKKIISIKDLGDCKAFLSNLDNSSFILNVTINNDNYDTIKYLIKHSQSIKDCVEVINLNLPYEMIPKDDFEAIYNLGVMLPKTRCNVIVNHRYIEDDRFIDKTGSVMWSLPTIIKANKAIHDICNFIKANNFSPFEAYAYIHDYVSTIAQYNISSAGGTWLSHDQFFPGVFFDLPEVVCMGYSSLEKEIIDTLNMPGLKCDIVSVSFYNKDKYSRDDHARCLVRVLDNKYGINQSCYEDTTWDNIDASQDCVSMYAHFAMDINCHERKQNDKYEYYAPSLIELKPKHTKNVVDITCAYEYNKSINPVSQLQIERAYFNMLVKSKPNESFNSLYVLLAKMAKKSYDEQVFRRFKGNLVQENLLLTKEEAKIIFNQNNKHKKLECSEKER